MTHTSTTATATRAFDTSSIGRPGTAHVYDVTQQAIDSYAAATDDVAGGPVFAVVPIWPALAPASLAVASVEIRPQVVHYEQDIRINQPIRAGMTLRAQATPIALLIRPNGTSLVIRAETHDGDGRLVNEQYVTEFFRGAVADESVGERPPAHRLETQGAPFAEITYPVAEDQTVRYAAASGDDFAIHLDDEFARGVGLPGRILHGLCTMAFAGRAVLEAAGVDDPHSVRRLAVRFSAPLFPGDSLTTRVWRSGDVLGFECYGADGVAVIKDGLAELR